jgi:hypothetical protein
VITPTSLPLSSVSTVPSAYLMQRAIVSVNHHPFSPSNNPRSQCLSGITCLVKNPQPLPLETHVRAMTELRQPFISIPRAGAPVTTIPTLRFVPPCVFSCSRMISLPRKPPSLLLRAPARLEENAF